jgi:hypothetical protein
MSTTTAIREKPILFSTPMAQAILDGRKVQTRRLVKPQPPEGWRPIAVERYNPAVEDSTGMMSDGLEIFGAYNEDWGVACKYGGPGDRLWVKEALRINKSFDSKSLGSLRGWVLPHYEADGEPAFPENLGRYRHARFVPRVFSRITLEITDVRVERLQQISIDDIGAEGVQVPRTDNGLIMRLTGKFLPSDYLPNGFFLDKRPLDKEQIGMVVKAHFASLWDKINGVGSWDSDPWVWCLSFRRLESTP